MSWKASGWAKETTGHRSHGAKLLLMVLADYHDDERGYAWPSQARLARDCDMGERTVRWCLDRLERQGFVTTIQKGNQYQPSQYRLNFAVTIAGAQVCEPATSAPTPETPLPVHSFEHRQETAPATLAGASEPAISDKVNRQFHASEPAILVGTSPQEPPPPVTPPVETEPPGVRGTYARTRGEGFSGESTEPKTEAPPSSVEPETPSPVPPPSPAPWQAPPGWEPLVALPEYRRADHTRSALIITVGCQRGSVPVAEVIVDFADYWPEGKIRWGWIDPVKALTRTLDTQVSKTRKRLGLNGTGPPSQYGRPPDLYEKRREMERGTSKGRPIQSI